MSRPPRQRVGDPRASPRPVRDARHELYEGTRQPEPAPGAMPAVAAGGNGNALPDAGSQGYRGEFEQRTVDAHGAGPAGEVRSREQLREALAERITAEPEFADCAVQVELDPQGVTLSGSVGRIAQRERLVALAHAARAGRVEDRLHVDAPHGGA